MSSSTSSTGIYFSGLSSGIDTDSIIQKLVQIEGKQVSRLKEKQTTIATRQAVLTSLKSQLSNLSTASAALNTSTAFTSVSATSSNTDGVTVTASNTAAAGTYKLEISKLALSHKIGSTNISDATTALGWTGGTFTVNGKGITVSSTDSLTSIAQKINSASAGVTASVINGGTGNCYLTIAANSTGAASKIQIADLSGSTIASNLGLVSGSLKYRETITGGVTSASISSASTALNSVFGVASLGSKTFNLNGTDISVNLDTQSLADVATAINTSGSGATASVRSVTATDGTTRYKLDIKGITTYTDADGFLQGIGVLQQDAASVMSSAQDASYKIDNIAMTSDTNTLTSVIPGVTLNLLKANETTPVTSTISLTSDTASTVTKVKTFIDAFNAFQSFISTNSKFDTATYESGVLFGDSVAMQVEDQLTTMALNNVPGLSSKYSNLMAMGVSMTQSGQLQLDETAFKNALAEDPDAVSKVFRAAGTGSSDSITFVSNTSKSVASGDTGYVVSISQLATQSSYTSSTAQVSASTLAETLTFSGSIFGSTSYALNLEIGSTLSSTINKINTDSKLKDLVSAVDDGGKLKLVSKKYGSSSGFSVVSSLDAGTDNSGIGKLEEGTKVVGLNVAGKINGEDATGNGQYLTGNEGNETTSGLQILYTGTITGDSVGSMKFTKGVGSRMFDLVYSYTDSVSGLFATTDKELQTQYDDLSDQITELNDRLSEKEDELRSKFSAMESALENLKSQQAQLNALLGNSSSSS